MRFFELKIRNHQREETEGRPVKRRRRETSVFKILVVFLSKVVFGVVFFDKPRRVESRVTIGPVLIVVSERFFRKSTMM